jgi:hypothetical protein
MPESIKTPDGVQPYLHSQSSLIAPTSNAFRKMRTIMEAIGVFGILTIKLFFYLGMGKLCNRRRGI